MSSIIQVFLVAAIFIVCAVIYIPFSPTFPYGADVLDGGWVFALNQAVGQHLIFGKNIIFTFGPYASLYTREYNPDTAHIMFFGTSLMAIAFAFVLLCLSKHSSKIVALILAFLVALSPSDTQFIALSFAVLAFICQLAERYNPSAFEKITLLLIALALGMFPLIKATFGICAIVVFCFAMLLLINRRKFKTAFCAAILLAGWVAFLWVEAGQPLRDLPHFFIAQLPVITGYSAAMSIFSSWLQVPFFVCFGFFVWFFGNQKLHIKNDAKLALALGSALILFLAFKEGLVRDDLHRLTAGGMLAASGVIFLLANKTKSSLIACVVGVIGFFAFNFPHFNMYVFHNNERGMVSILKNPGIYKVEYDASVQAIRSSQPLPALSGTTDIYSWGQSSLLAAGLEWDPRPIFQSYSAYTPVLEEENKHHLIGAEAPKNIFFALQTIDYRLPSLEDGASWPLLLANYQFKGFYENGNVALLERRVNPLPIKTSLILSSSFKTNTLIKLPQNLPIAWAEITIHPNLLGRVAGALFKPPLLMIRYVFPNGQAQEFRYIAGMGETGFVLSPLVTSTNDFIQLTMPDSENYFLNRRPSYVSIVVGRYSRFFWSSHFSFKVSDLQFTD